MLAISALSLVVSVAVTAVLIPTLQAEGAAIGFAAAECAMAGGTYWFLRVARARKPVSGLRVPVRVFAALAGGLSALLLPIGSFGQAVLSFAVYSAVLVVSRAIPPEIAAALGEVRLPRLGAASRAPS
jgi:O-antigen/teichoic acid export membrane protein